MVLLNRDCGDGRNFSIVVWRKRPVRGRSRFPSYLTLEERGEELLGGWVV